MNLTNLEKLARMAVKGGNINTESRKMLHNGLLSPAEHKSVTSLSWQIAANVQAGTQGNTAALKIGPMAAWF